jgi:hypothetical protein
VSWSSARLEGLGEVAEHEADAVVREEKVRRELGARGPLLLLLCLLRRHVPVSLPRRRCDGPGPRVGVGGEAGGGGFRVAVGRVGGGGGRCGGAVAGPVARPAALVAARGRRRRHVDRREGRLAFRLGIRGIGREQKVEGAIFVLPHGVVICGSWLSCVSFWREREVEWRQKSSSVFLLRSHLYRRAGRSWPSWAW